MPGRSDVYLVSAKNASGTGKDAPTFDNPGFQSNDNVGFSVTNGVDLPEVKQEATSPYRGMGKDDLLRFSSTPFWRRLRMICISIVLLGWLALIITIVALVLVYPKCRDPGSRSWWQTEAVYRIYVPSFKDSNEDGIGDLAGITSKLGYIQDLGFGIISLSPFYTTAIPSSNEFSEGNDMAITNHVAVDANYGTMADFEALIQAAHDKGMYVVLDFIPNHTSDQHPWFLDSSSSTNNSRKNFYVWSDTSAAPNDWMSVYSESAWTLNSSRNQAYLHQFRPETPDLNLRSAMVQDELEVILNFWLDKGVDGFNVLDAGYLFEDYDMRDDPLKPGAKTGSTNYDDYDHIYTKNLPEVYNMLERWRDILQHHNKTSTEKLLMTGAFGGLDPGRLYGDCDQSGVQMPLNGGLLDKTSSCDGACIVQYVDGWMHNLPSGKWANWMAGDDNTPRFASRFNASFIQAYTILSFLMPGTPVMYYGDEISMIETGSDGAAWSRDRNMRRIMRWDNSSINGGFCNATCTPWTDIGEVSTGSIQDTLPSLIKDLVALRAEASFRVGDYFEAVRDSSVVSFVREFDGETGYLVAVNFGSNTETRDFTKSHDTIQSDAVVALSYGTSHEVDDEVDTTDLKIEPYGGVVVSWDYVAKEL